MMTTILLSLMTSNALGCTDNLFNNGHVSYDKIGATGHYYDNDFVGGNWFENMNKTYEWCAQMCWSYHHFLDHGCWGFSLNSEVPDDERWCYTYWSDPTVSGDAQLEGDNWEMYRLCDQDTPAAEPVALPADEPVVTGCTDNLFNNGHVSYDKVGPTGYFYDDYFTHATMIENMNKTYEWCAQQCWGYHNSQIGCWGFSLNSEVPDNERWCYLYRWDPIASGDALLEGENWEVYRMCDQETSDPEPVDLPADEPVATGCTDDLFNNGFVNFDHVSSGFFYEDEWNMPWNLNNTYEDCAQKCHDMSQWSQCWGFAVFTNGGENDFKVCKLYRTNPTSNTQVSGDGWEVYHMCELDGAAPAPAPEPVSTPADESMCGPLPEEPVENEENGLFYLWALAGQSCHHACVAEEMYCATNAMEAPFDQQSYMAPFCDEGNGWWGSEERSDAFAATAGTNQLKRGPFRKESDCRCTKNEPESFTCGLALPGARRLCGCTKDVEHERWITPETKGTDAEGWYAVSDVPCTRFCKDKNMECDADTMSEMRGVNDLSDLLDIFGQDLASQCSEIDDLTMGSQTPKRQNDLCTIYPLGEIPANKMPKCNPKVFSPGNRWCYCA